jgi:Na+/melibiose symporter-like transporter
METLTNFTKFLQACITPVALISGVGLLLLTITHRIGRVVDRIRNLVRELDTPDVKREEVKKDQILILLKRAKLLKNSIAWLLIGMISSCLIIPLLFFMNLFGTDLKLIGHLLFVVSILSMLISFFYFFKDVLQSLNALRLEASEYNT